MTKRRNPEPNCDTEDCRGEAEVWWAVRDAPGRPWRPRVYCAAHGGLLREMERAHHGPINYREGVN